MTAALLIVALVLVAGVAAGALYLVWALDRRHDARLHDLMDRIQAPEAKQVAAIDALLAERPAPAAPPQPEVLLPQDEDFHIDALLSS